MDKRLSDLLNIVDNTVRELYRERDELLELPDIKEEYLKYFNIFSPSYNIVLIDDIIHEKLDLLISKFIQDWSFSKEIGFSYVDEETRPWLNEQESEIEWYYWQRYENYLLRDKKWSPRVVKTLANDTYNVLDLTANPKSANSFKRRGLVMASVQSGKTSNYTGLICRAADVGYKIIIVMAGVHNILRNQTQTRLEEGFTGFNIVREREIVGVGKLSTEKRPIALTSRDSDFNKKRAEAFRGIQSDNTNAPFLLVIKKNSNSLRQIYEWLTFNCDSDDPVLLIDDEADNASINGKYIKDKRVDEVTCINKQIRKILKFFNKCVYVGYTATPFANILIDPDIELEEIGKDLFPKSFIYTLEESSDYFGAKTIFSDDEEENPKYIRYINDNELLIPKSHKSNFWVEGLPQSLKFSIRYFILATCIRRIRNDDTHSTMMINASPYTKVQNSISFLVKDYVIDIKDAIKSFSALSKKAALSSSPLMQDLYDTWKLELSFACEDWDLIQHALYETIKPLRVANINSKSGDALDYESQTENVIAIGGYRLSRGLTLEGLTVSYYLRNAKAYDALMQMARWFGYRPGYEDLCRIWMTEETVGWYKFVSEATEGLIAQLRSMRQQGKTPRDFGLRIKQHPDTLMVTARNKLGKSHISFSIDYNNSFIETVATLRDESARDANIGALNKLINSLQNSNLKITTQGSGFLFIDVPSSFIKNFIKNYRNADNQSVATSSEYVTSYIERAENEHELTTWDILLAGGKGEAVPPLNLANGISLNWERRKPGSESSHEILWVGEKRRVSSRGVCKTGLSASEIVLAEQKYQADNNLKVGPNSAKKGNCSDRYYNAERTRPLLVIHPILYMFDKNSKRSAFPSGISHEVWPHEDYYETAIGWTIAFPISEKIISPSNYVLNEIAIKELTRGFIAEDTDDDAEDDNDE